MLFQVNVHHGPELREIEAAAVVQRELFGRAISEYGDWDRDGTPEFVVSVPHREIGESKAVHRVFLVSGKGGSSLVAWSSSVNGFGEFVTAVPDVDGDGRPELLIQNDVDRGWLVSGSGQSVIRELSFVRYGRGPGVWSIGDLDADGKPDLARAGKGGALVVERAVDGFELMRWPGIAPADLASVSGPTANAARELLVVTAVRGELRLGIELLTLRFGTPEIANKRVFGKSGPAGWPRLCALDDAGTAGARVVLGCPESGSGQGCVQVVRSSDLSLLSSFSPTSRASMFGASVDAVGDLDADGLCDFVVASPPMNLFRDGGGAYVYLSASPDTPRIHRSPAIDADPYTSVAGVGDIDGDGLGDYALSDARFEGLGNLQGSVSVYSGRDGLELLRLPDCWSKKR
jgi:hypothetical protein